MSTRLIGIIMTDDLAECGFHTVFTLRLLIKPCMCCHLLVIVYLHSTKENHVCWMLLQDKSLNHLSFSSYPAGSSIAATWKMHATVKYGQNNQGNYLSYMDPTRKSVRRS